MVFFEALDLRGDRISGFLAFCQRFGDVPFLSLRVLDLCLVGGNVRVLW